ncbi:MAG: FecCD family ABC transporter permease [bacterium JZ-2024 1]
MRSDIATWSTRETDLRFALSGIEKLWWLALVGLISLVIGLGSGGWSVLFDAIAGNPTAFRIVTSVRLPRVLMGLVVGANLAISGAVLQALFRNPLASPFVLGVSGGAALGAAFAIVFLSSLPWPAPAITGLVFALFTAHTVFWIARRPSGKTKPESILLAGVMMNAFYGALILLFQYLSAPGGVYQVVFWMMGSIQASDVTEAGWLALLSLPAWLALIWRVRLVNTFSLGEEIAGTSGIEVEAFKRILYWSSSWIVAITVSVAGIIPFVGLVVPHIIRRVFGADHRLVIPGSLVGGAAFLILSDGLARGLVAPLEFPPGVVTSLIGTPFFLWIMRETESRRV